VNVHLSVVLITLSHVESCAKFKSGGGGARVDDGQLTSEVCGLARRGLADLFRLASCSQNNPILNFVHHSITHCSESLLCHISCMSALVLRQPLRHPSLHNEKYAV